MEIDITDFVLNAQRNLSGRTGKIVKPREPFSEDRWDECASGIHFYLTRIEAENH